MTCPSCGDTIELNDAMLEEGSIVCPGCGETLEFDFDDDEEESEEDEKELVFYKRKAFPFGKAFLYAGICFIS